MFLRTVCLLGVALLLQGCVLSMMTLAMQGMDGGKTCNPRERNRALYLAQHINQVPYGADTTGVLESVGRPEQYRRVMANTANGQLERYDVWMYRTGSEQCGNMPTQELYTPLVFNRGHVVGKGAQFYTTRLLPHAKSDVALATGNEFRQGMTDIIDYAIYPFNKVF